MNALENRSVFNRRHDMADDERILSTSGDVIDRFDSDATSHQFVGNGVSSTRSSRSFHRFSPPSSTLAIGGLSPRVTGNTSSSSLPLLSSTPPGGSSSASAAARYGGGGACELPPLSLYLNPHPHQHHQQYRRRYNSGSGDSLQRMLQQQDFGAAASVGGGWGGRGMPAASGCRLRVSRDPTQPSSGSVRSLRSMSTDGSADDDNDEESDEFPTIGGRGGLGGGAGGGFPIGCHRPRAATCPETKAFRRRALARAMNRPPTPTPSVPDDVVEELDASISCLAVDELPEDGETTVDVVEKSRSEDGDGETERDDDDDCTSGIADRRPHLFDVGHHLQSTRRPPGSVNGFSGGSAFKLPPLHQDIIGACSGSPLTDRIVFGSSGSTGGRTPERSSTNGNGCSCAGSPSELLPVITETM